MATNYYFNSSGDDSNDGLSPATAWKTTTNANTFTFSAGDHLLFAGGQTFSPGILLDATDGGDAVNPLFIGSYGTGRATIDGQSTNAITINNRAGIVISNLNAIGSGPTNNTGDGIAFYSTLPDNSQLPMIIVDHVDVSGFGGSGVCFVSWNGQTGFRDVWVMNSAMHDNRTAGLLTYATQANTHSNIYVGLCATYNNFGDTNHQGSGMVLGEVIHATVEWCVSHDNGKFAGGQGPVGIWTYDSTDVTIQFNEAYNNRQNTGYDGGGFDLDYNTKNAVVQYNYSHENDGPGYMLCCDGLTASNVIRYNISQNDCRQVHNGAIHSYGSGHDTQIYNNSVYLPPSEGQPIALMLFGPTINFHVHNNIFQTTDGTRLVWLGVGQTNLSLQGNDYWSSGDRFSIVDSGTEFTSFNTWTAQTSREHLNGAVSGLNVDPMFSAPGTGPTLNDATQLRTVTQYQLQGGSALIDAGLDLRQLFSIDPGTRDFLGSPIPVGRGYDIGANEFVLSYVLRFTGIQWNSGNTFLTIVGPPQRTNVLESSSNLINWDTVSTWVNKNDTTNFIDPNADDAMRFYRARELTSP